MIEVIGYVASGLIVVSLALHRTVPLRVVSLLGAGMFVGYGLLIGSWPVVVSNAVIVAVTVWQLYREATTSHDLALVRTEPSSPFLEDFITGHLKDIQKSQPNFTGARPGDLAFVYLRDGMPAGALIGSTSGDRFNVHLDYVLPAFRDTRLARWLYQGSGLRHLRAAGIREVAERAATEVHRGYLREVGFVPEGDRLVRRLS